MRLLLTHGTATGRAAGAALLRDGDLQAWLPWDTPRGGAPLPRPLRAARRRADGDRDLAEPAAAAQARGLPMVLANARLSASAACGKRAAPGMRCCGRRSQRSSACWRRPRPMPSGCATPAREASRSPATSSSTSTPDAGVHRARPGVAPTRSRARWCWPRVTREGEEARAARGLANAFAAPRPLLAASCRAIRSASTRSPRSRRRAGFGGRGAVARRRRTCRPSMRPTDVWLGDSLRRDAAVLRASPTSPCSAAASRRSAART